MLLRFIFYFLQVESYSILAFKMMPYIHKLYIFVLLLTIVCLSKSSGEEAVLVILSFQMNIYWFNHYAFFFLIVTVWHYHFVKQWEYILSPFITQNLVELHSRDGTRCCSSTICVLSLQCEGVPGGQLYNEGYTSQHPHIQVSLQD